MQDEAYEIKILDGTGGPAMTLPFLGLLEFGFIGYVVKGLQENVGLDSYSTRWWIGMAVFAALAAANFVLIISTAIVGFRTFSTQQFLLINNNGILLPYESNPIKWGDISGYYIKETYMRGDYWKILRVTLKKPKYGLIRSIKILMKKGAYDNDDINNCMAMIDHFLPK